MSSPEQYKSTRFPLADRLKRFGRGLINCLAPEDPVKTLEQLGVLAFTQLDVVTQEHPYNKNCGKACQNNTGLRNYEIVSGPFIDKNKIVYEAFGADSQATPVVVARKDSSGWKLVHPPFRRA